MEYSEHIDDDYSMPPRRYGISIRLVIEIQKTSANANLSSLSFIAAYAELNMVTASCKLEILGISNPEIADLTASMSSDLKVESFVEMKQAFDKIKNLIKDEKTLITPSLIGVNVEEEIKK
jgi:hypothetical protein